MGDRQKQRVLLVDDSEVILAAAHYALSEAGFDVETRLSPEDAVARGTGGFDLILMDVQMPELFGDDVASVLRNVRDVKVPIYLYSTLDDAELAERAHDAGIEGYISKEQGVEAMVAEVRRILDSRNG